MWVDALLGGTAGALAAVLGAFATEALLLALRRRRNATFIEAGELPYKDEVFRPQWQLIGATGMLAASVASALGSSLYVAVGLALVPPGLLALVGLWFLRR